MTKEANMAIAKAALAQADAINELAEEAMQMFQGKFRNKEEILELMREQLRQANWGQK